MADEDYEVVWSGRGPLTPDAPQELYELQDRSKRTLVNLGLVRFGDGEELVRDASPDQDAYYLVPAWKKRKTKQKKEARATLKAATPHLTRTRDERYSTHARKLSDAEVRMIRRAYANGEGGFKTLAKRFGISNANVSQIIHRDVYRDVAD